MKNRDRRTIGAAAVLLAIVLAGVWWARHAGRPADGLGPRSAATGATSARDGPVGTDAAEPSAAGTEGTDDAPLEPHDLHGTVCDRDGVPIGGVRLELRGGATPRVTYADALGRYRFGAAERGDGARTLHVDPSANGEGFGPRLFEVPDDAQKLDVWLRLDGPRPKRFTLEVEFGNVDPDGDILRVFLIGRDGFPWFGATFPETPHDVIENLPIGTYQVIANQGSRSTFRRNVHVDPTSSPMRVFLEPGESIAGRVVDESGRPLAGFPLTLRAELVENRVVYPATLHAFLAREPHRSRIVVAKKTDRDGRFRFEGLPPIRHWVHGRSADGRLYAGTKVTLSRSGAVTDVGDLVARPGSARVRFHLQLRPDARPGQVRLRLISAYDAKREIVTAAREEIEVTDLPAGPYVVVVHKVDGPGAYRLSKTILLEVEEGGDYDVTVPPAH